MILDLQGWALRRAKASSHPRFWLRLFDVLRAVDLALAGLPADPRRT